MTRGTEIRIDLNCDMGEGEPSDERIMPFITSANVACGFHAGDAATMRRTVRLARAHAVAVGAHPSYADREGFGRRALDVDPEQVRDEVVYQIGALWGICRAEGVRLALEMPPEERRARMGRMRQTVREHNIYRWAGLLLSELQRIPEENSGAANNVLSPREGER